MKNGDPLPDRRLIFSISPQSRTLPCYGAHSNTVAHSIARGFRCYVYERSS